MVTVDPLFKIAKKLFGRRFDEASLPAFALTAQKIAQITDSDDQSLAELSEIILNDPGMTTRILRASGSAYRVRRGRTNTVSRAIVMLGLDEVKKICLGSAIVDSFMGNQPNESLTREMARAFHAATQARLIAVQKGERNTEEIFIATLMQSLGALVFCSVHGGDGDEGGEKEFADISAIVLPTEQPPEVIEKEQFGVTLSELSQVLAERWGLQSLIPEEAEKIEEIQACSSLARRAHLGWESPHVQESVAELQSLNNLDEIALQQVLASAAKEAATTAHFFGIPEVAEVLVAFDAEVSDSESMELPPLPDRDTLKELGSGVGDSRADGGVASLIGEAYQGLEADVTAQLEALQSISKLMLSRANPSLIIDSVLNGMVEGIGLDRVVFAIFDKEKENLFARVVKGYASAPLQKGFSFPVRGNSFLRKIGAGRVPHWIRGAELETVPGDMKKIISGGEFFISPLIANGKWIGVIYADRRPSQRDLSESLFAAFEQFSLQGSFALSKRV